ncbi:S41 family peptidase [Flavivirga algicola]|uniref:S41 family peptidase n=1 Tax=Flavivirga algicola TaxID=2729136 RepID=A0ABX1RY36_9FLAO|nr:S41 family peptidase [Flavivirga algicola]NMH87920.1 S41 family peptidase [Flavivirga algicola]
MKRPILKKEKFVKTLNRLFLCLLFFCCFACKSDDHIPPPINSTHGFWSIADKGYILEIADDKNILYNTSSAGCSILDNDFSIEKSSFDLEVVGPDELAGISKISLSKLKLTRLTDLDSSCLPDQISNTEDVKVNFDHFWSFFNDYYAFFELRGVNWANYKNYGSQVTEDNFYDILEELILLFEDGHVSIDDDENDIYVESGIPSLIERLNTNLHGDFVIEDEDDLDEILEQKAKVIIEKYLDGTFEQDREENMLWGFINDDIAYLNILGMGGFGTDLNDELASLNSVLDEIMEDIKNSAVSKLIIDIRFNGGGFDKVSSEIASRFTNQDRVVFSKKARLGNGFTEDQVITLGPKGDFQFDKDIVLLTGPLTASAAEIFTLYLKDLPYVTIVGENTNGVFSDILTHALPNGALIGLSNEVYSDTKGIIYEAVGVGPVEENKVPFLSNNDLTNNTDGGIEKAIEVLNN